MSEYFLYKATVTDWQNHSTVMNYRIPATGVDQAAEDANARTAMANLKAALLAVTDGNITKETLTAVEGGTSTLPATSEHGVEEEIVISAYLSGAAEIPKYATLRIPAPEDDLFATLVDVDLAAADLVAYVAAIAANAEVSDGEVVNTTVTNGIADAYWRSRAKIDR